MMMCSPVSRLLLTPISIQNTTTTSFEVVKLRDAKLRVAYNGALIAHAVGSIAPGSGHDGRMPPGIAPS